MPFEIASFGGESPADKQARAVANGKAPKGKAADARISLIRDLVAATKACQKSGIDLRNPMIRASLVASGGSALALASRIGPEKTLAALKHFTALAEKHGPYIRHLEKSYMEMRKFSMSLRRALGPCPKAAKKAVAKNANMGGWGIVMALGALGAAVFYVVRAFSKSDESMEEKLTATSQSFTPVKLKDAAAKKYIPAKLSSRKDEKTGQVVNVYAGELKGQPFKIECTPNQVPVWSGIRWTCMPLELAAKVEVVEDKVAGFHRRDIHPKDCKGIDSSCGSLEEIVGSSAVERARQHMLKSMVNWHKAEHAKKRAAMAGIKPNPVSPPMKVSSQVLNTYRGIRTQMPADRRFLAAVVDRRQPLIWPGSRGGYSYSV